MAGVGNSSGFGYQYSNTALLNNSTYCLNLSDNLTLLDANNSRCDPPAEDKGSTPVVIAIIITAVYSIVCVVGVVGNVLVMYVIIR